MGQNRYAGSVGQVRRGGVVAALLVLALVGWYAWHRTSGAETTLVQASRGSASVSVGSATKQLTVPGLAARRIAGVVTLEGAPVANATVTLRGTLEHLPALVTDAAGHFDFGPQVPSSYVVAAEAPRLTAALRSIDLRDPRVQSDRLELALQPCDASIYGTIYDNAGGTVANAQLFRRTQDIGTRSGAGALSDASGAYEMCVLPGREWIEVSADGYARVVESVTAYSRIKRDFTLNPGAAIAGHVIRASDHQPVEGAIVELDEDEAVMTRADGRFEIEGLTAGRHVVTAKAEGLVLVQPVHPVAAVGVPGDDVICELDPAFSISGTIVDRATRTPQPGLVVYAMSRGRLESQSYSARARGDGTFTIEGLPPGDYEATVESHPSTNVPPLGTLHVNPSVQGVVLEIAAVGSIAGRITRGGKPVADAVVTANGRNATTDASGHYEIGDLQPETYSVSAQATRIGAFTKPRSVKVDNGEHKTAVDFELDLSASIAGVVVDQNDAPVAGVVVQFSLLHDSDFGIATTGDDGTFTATAMSGGGEYVYQVQRGSDASTPFRSADGKRFPLVALKDGTTHLTGLRIKIRVDRLSIAGRVLDGNGQPVPDVTVSAGTTDWQRSSQQSVTDQSGAFAIRDLRSGPYRLTTSALGDSSVTTVEAGKTDIVIRLAASGSIEGTLEQFPDRPEVAVVSMSARPYDRIYGEVSGTTFRIRSLPPGEYSLSAMSGAAYASALVTVAPGRTAKAVLRAKGFGAIAGTFADASHKGLAGYCNSTGAALDAPANASADAKGEFRIEHVPAGDAIVFCRSDDAYAGMPVAVVANEVTRVDLVARAASQKTYGSAGIYFEYVFDEAIVARVNPGGAGERAGLQVDDSVISVDGGSIAELGSWTVRRAMWGKPVGTVVNLVVERGGKQLPISVTLDAEPE